MLSRHGGAYRTPAVLAQGYMDLNIIHEDGLLAPCKFHLMTKDGVFLMQIPRLVDDLVMAAANRQASSWSQTELFNEETLTGHSA